MRIGQAVHLPSGRSRQNAVTPSPPAHTHAHCPLPKLTFPRPPCSACRSAVASAGLDWTFSEADTVLVRCVTLTLSIGGMLVTALLLSLVSGAGLL